jgi:uncharacterized Fe-S cluster-containing radical SAM superfamily protein
MPIDTKSLAARYRAATVDLANKKLLVTNFRGTEQEKDLTEAANCDGFGRIRHFHRKTSPGWPANPLPIDPAGAALCLGHRDEIRAQVFQNAACNWRCWYCFVPFNLLSADRTHSAWLTPLELLQLFLKQPDRPLVLDLSGGQPELVPEWTDWMIEEIESNDLRGQVYLWSDDNLSCDYFWRYLNSAQQEAVARYPYYGRVACFKGFDEDSFAFNTRAEKSWFKRQFELMQRLVRSGMDVYAYATFTAPTSTGISEGMPRFIDQLQAIHENLPLRTVPLEIQKFTPVLGRLDGVPQATFDHQWRAVELWQRELDRRFSASIRDLPITEIRIGKSAVARS